MFTTDIGIAIITTAILTLGAGIGYLAARPTIRRQRAELATAAWQLAHDPLTGLLNRTGLRAVHATVAASTEPQPIIVMLIDLDRFKDVNDTFGHDSGDNLIIGIATRLGQLATAYGGVAARLAGDEFAALLPVCDDQISGIADRFLAAIAEPVHLHGEGAALPVSVTASLGLAIVTSTDALEGIALNRADTAMYHAKHQGGNRHIQHIPGMTMPDRAHRQGPRPRDHRHDRNGITA